MHNLSHNSSNACSPFVHFSMPGNHFMDPQFPRVPSNVCHNAVFAPQMQQQQQQQHQEQTLPLPPPVPASMLKTEEDDKESSPPPPPPADRQQQQDKDGMEDHYEKQLASYMNCKHCDYICKQRDRMVRHVKNVHLKEKPFVCDICNHCFGRKDKLKRHQLTVHSTERPFKCDFCSHSCNRKDKLKAHVQGVHFKSLPSSITVKASKSKKQRNNAATAPTPTTLLVAQNYAEYKDTQCVDLSKDPLMLKHSQQ